MKLKLDKPGLVELDPKLINPNLDKRAVTRLAQSYDAYMKSQIAAALESAQRSVDTMEQLADPSLFTFDQKKAGVLAKKARREMEAMASEKPSRAETISGHNPNLFPPFFTSFRATVSGGVVTMPIFRVRPDIGMIGLSVAAYPPVGYIDRRSFMGAFAVAPSTEILTATASTFVSGIVGAISVLGSGVGTAVLMVTILASGARGLSAATGTLSLGTTAFGPIRIPLTNMTATARLMVNAGDVMIISCGLVVSAGCFGLICSAASNIALSGTVLCVV